MDVNATSTISHELFGDIIVVIAKLCPVNTKLSKNNAIVAINFFIKNRIKNITLTFYIFFKFCKIFI
ncbi:MAG: hypothetical protein LBQ24_07000 [Candidatus Peribacteria bacterium]|nr:hypothetical protein [Candidatus Peribacteria bacterium]